MAQPPLRLCFDPEPGVLAAARECEADVFLDAYGNTVQELDAEYSAYDDHSHFLAVADTDDQVLAAARLIFPSQAGLKSLNDTAREPWHIDGDRSARLAGIDPDRAMDVATISVRRGVKGPGLLAAIALYRGIVLVTRMNRLDWIVMIMDLRARRLLHSVGLQTQVLPGTAPASYLGSASSVPVWAKMSAMLDGQRTISPDGFRMVAQGVGLDGISVGPDSEFLAIPHYFEPSAVELVGLAESA